MDDPWDELSSSELLACALGEHPAFRSGADLDRIDPRLLSGGEQIDLLAVLEEQRRWFEAAQLRALAAIQARDDSRLGLGQEGVSLALQVPLRTAQARLAQAATLVADLPRTLAAVASGAISASHAGVVAEALWRLPADPGLPAALEEAVLPPVLAAGCVTVPQLNGGSAARCWPWTRRRLRSGTYERSWSGGWSTTRARTAWPASSRCCPPRRPG